MVQVYEGSVPSIRLHSVGPLGLHLGPFMMPATEENKEERKGLDNRINTVQHRLKDCRVVSGCARVGEIQEITSRDMSRDKISLY